VSGRELKLVAEAAGISGPGGDVLASLFDNFPHGLMVVSASGEVAAANGALREMLGVTGDGMTGRTCCTVLGCAHEPGGDGCVTTRVLAGREVLRDVAVDLPEGRGPARISASSLGPRHRSLVVELRRPAAAVGPQPVAGAVRVRALGTTRVEIDGEVADRPWVDQRPGQLLKYLVAERERVVSIEDIAEALWPSAEFTTVNSVRHLVHVLRGHLEPQRTERHGSGGVLSRRGGYTVDLGVVAVDADEFVRAATAALATFAAGEPAATSRLESALGFYGGDFLADEPYARWVQAERERLRALADRLLRALADLALDRGDVGAATAYVERLADLEPFDGDIQRQLITLAVREGRRGRALRMYHAFDLRLARAFGEHPDFRLEDVLQKGAAPVRLADAERWRREQEVRHSLR
jgi:DNA-binding SARP family transcriptional activator